MRGGNWVWRRSILASIFIFEATHQHTLIIFMNSSATGAAEAAELRFSCSPSKAGGGGGGMCVRLFVCALPVDFYDATEVIGWVTHIEKSPLALGMCSCNPSMPLWNPESGLFFQLAHIKWFPVLRLLPLCSSIRGRASNAAVERPDGFLITDC